MKAYLVDVGVLEDAGFDDGAYSTVYDRKYAYFDEGQFYCASKERAITQAMAYVEQGVDGTYGIVSETFVDGSGKEIEEMPVSQEQYDVNSIVFSARKENGVVVQDFIETSSQT